MFLYIKKYNFFYIYFLNIMVIRRRTLRKKFLNKKMKPFKCRFFIVFFPKNKNNKKK